ncbi:hypothetical protein [Crossiella sp. CA198]|uniref:hypothetical protein n=1 Tax=Crossiella sp. CA198 TaxID=3455607 RepID=UPI003F8D549E
MSPALGPVRDDPAVQAGYAAQDAYLTCIQEIRENWSGDLDELAQAEQIVTAYEALLAELDRLRTDLHDRRRARLTELETLVPVGAGVPEDASAADAAVLNAAFRTALEKARDAGGSKARRELLAEAERYNDDTLRRGVLTAAFEAGELDTLNDWARAHTDLDEGFATELRTLRGQLAGTIRADAAWEQQALRAPRRPQEVFSLPTLRSAREATDKARRAEIIRRR